MRTPRRWPTLGSGTVTTSPGPVQVGRRASDATLAKRRTEIKSSRLNCSPTGAGVQE